MKEIFQPLVVFSESQKSSFQKLECDWDGNQVQPALEFQLRKQDDKLHFLLSYRSTVRFDPISNSSDNPFKAELWKRDVAELFLCDDSSEAYQEFNFAPSGAWWSAHFSSYRDIIAECPDCPGLSIMSEIKDSCWKLLVEIPLSSLAIQCSLSEQSRLSVCAILGDGSRFLSTARYKGDTADFHRVKEIPVGLIHYR